MSAADRLSIRGLRPKECSQKIPQAVANSSERFTSASTLIPFQPQATSNVNAIRRGIPWVILGVAISAVAVSWWSEGIIYDLIGNDLTPEQRIDRLKIFFEDFGVFAPAVYVVFVIVEVVVAPIPGLMLYAPGGIIFGAFTGGSLSLLGNVLGAGIACAITRTLGSSWLSTFFETEKLEKTQTAIERRGGWLVFLLRLNPLTSSDIVSYAAGFTRIPVWKVMLATCGGMAPLCYAQAWLAEGLINSFPWLIYPLLVVCGIYAIGVCWVVRKILLQPA